MRGWNEHQATVVNWRDANVAVGRGSVSPDWAVGVPTKGAASNQTSNQTVFIDAFLAEGACYHGPCPVERSIGGGPGEVPGRPW